MRRARPLLGTFVEVTAKGGCSQDTGCAVDAAFSVIERVHRLMSFHDPSSDLTRLNRGALRRPVRVDPWTYEVVSRAINISSLTEGAFDITVAPLLQKWGYLPVIQENQRTDKIGEARDIELLGRNRIRFHRPLQIDLGGIAKGFAVDRAVMELQARGMTSGLVNAGGDLRIFGHGKPVLIRHPGNLGLAVPLCASGDGAVATSATYLSRKRWKGRWVSAVVDSRRRSACHTRVSVSVQARDCCVADALTKVLLGNLDQGASLLPKFSAQAFVVTPRGEVFSTEAPDEA